MKVPEEILSVPRPEHTVVIDKGIGRKRYAVLQRNGYVYRPGKGSSPRNGRTIGHIVDLKYQPVEPMPGASGGDYLSFGVAAFVHENMMDVQSELMQIWDIGPVYAIMALIVARIQEPEIPNRTVSQVFQASFSSVYWPDAPVSKNSLTKLLKGLGMDAYKRRSFFATHIANLGPQHHILIDGMLKQDTSRTNNISDYSYKIREDSAKQISVIYAYSLEKMEPICAEVFPGNCVDAAAFAAFIRDNNITEGLIIADKGFPVSAMESELEENPKLHYLLPLRRGSIYEKDYHLNEFDTPLKMLGEKGIVGKKVQAKDGRWLYSFRDLTQDIKETRQYWRQSVRNGTYEESTFRETMVTGGTIAFISDIELDLEKVYIAYHDRWLIEQLFDRYKSDLDQDITRVQSTFSVRGNEFVNFLCVLATFRILNKARQSGLLDKFTFGDVVKALCQASRARKAPRDILPKKEDRFWEDSRYVKYEVLVGMGLAEAPPKNRPKNLRQRKICQSVQEEGLESILGDLNGQNAQGVGLGNIIPLCSGATIRW